ncbi:MAG: FeoA domain-containing protein [Brachymonas sp.]|nr:FeoA domain-containing protein [Brachymonas sp.]
MITGDHAVTALSIATRIGIAKVGGEGALRRRLLDMGLTPGTQVTLHKIAPLGDPLELELRLCDVMCRGAILKTKVVAR